MKNHPVVAGACWNLNLGHTLHAFDSSRIGEVVEGDTYCPTITLSKYRQASSHQSSHGGGWQNHIVFAGTCWNLNLGHTLHAFDSSRIGEVVEGDTCCPTITLSKYRQASSHQSSW